MGTTRSSSFNRALIEVIRSHDKPVRREQILDELMISGWKASLGRVSKALEWDVANLVEYTRDKNGAKHYRVKE